MNTKAIRAVITGSTGMVGEGVLHECLQHPDVAAILVINRKPCGIVHPKLQEILHQDFFNLTPVEQALTGFNACFFCLGVSSVGMKAEKYYNLTYTLTLHAGETLSRLNPGMTFCYISGAGTDSTEKGRSRWARVKGKTENDLMKLASGMYSLSGRVSSSQREACPIHTATTLILTGCSLWGGHYIPTAFALWKNWDWP